ncbi:hypothetical protein BGZ76_008103 [Entomortierella beljakovae]|nr:hypothetical protein BGZ76_008103 [Entomortierella beljakovae]
MTSETPKKSMLYTRTGDRGESSLYNGERRTKTDRIFEALGVVDELNSSIGFNAIYKILGPTLQPLGMMLPNPSFICRRAERTTIPVVEANDADESVLKYLNRLSDYLFAAARFAAKFDKLEENVYKKAKSGREASIQTRSL